MDKSGIYINTINNADCIEFMKGMKDNTVDLTLTDIPYDGVNRKSNGLRSLDKGLADVMQFDINEFLESVYRVTKNCLIIFCGQNQISPIFNYFIDKQAKHQGTVRQLIWEKSNPSPMNGQHIYLSGIENAIWFKKRGGCLTLIAKILCSNTLVGAANYTPPRRTITC